MATIERRARQRTPLTAEFSPVLSESVREQAVRIAAEVAPKPAKKGRPWVTPNQVSRARRHGDGFVQALRFARAATPEGAQILAAEFQAIADAKSKALPDCWRAALLEEEVLDAEESLLQMRALSDGTREGQLAYRNAVIRLVAALRTNLLVLDRELGL